MAAVEVQQSIPGAVHELQLSLVQTQPIVCTINVSTISSSNSVVLDNTVVFYEYFEHIAAGVDVQVRAPDTSLREVLYGREYNTN